MEHCGSPRILFILKRFSEYGYSYGHKASGLYNSAKFVVDMLNTDGVDAKLITVVDNNDIDREVTAYKPDVVIIEALWVVPEKFDVLVKLHPNVRWVVRGHSDVPFIASEGVAVDWVFKYLAHRNVYVAFNSPRITADFKALDPKFSEKVFFLPNFYPLVRCYKKHEHKHLKVGCFGAIRPMKNQLLQAIAAIRYANKIGKTLEFNINSTRCEQSGNEVLKNLISLFENTKHKLVEHPWMNHGLFLEVMHGMDIAMSVSLSETFCITAADAVSVGTPLVCSSEIPWASKFSIAPTTDADAIVHRIEQLLNSCFGRAVTRFNRRNLRSYSAESRRIWLETFKGDSCQQEQTHLIFPVRKHL